jgi:hypothetical protein
VSPSFNGGSPADERNSESDETSSTPSTSTFGAHLNGLSSNSNNLDASRRLIETLLDIESRLEASHEFKSDPANSRQKAIELLVNWSNLLHPLPEIAFNDKVRSFKKAIINFARFQVQLLNNSKSPFVLLDILQKSTNCSYLLMPDGFTKLSFSAQYPNEVSTLISRIMDELIAPLRRMNVERAEFVTIKAFLLLQPDLGGLNVMSRDRIRESRDSFMRALFGYLCSRSNAVDASIRQSSLLMLIPSLFSIGKAIAENSTLCSLFGLNEDNVYGTPTIASPPINTAPNVNAEQLLKMIGNCKSELLGQEMLLAAQLLSQHQSMNNTTASPPLSDGLPSAFSSIPSVSSDYP